MRSIEDIAREAFLHDGLVRIRDAHPAISEAMDELFADCFERNAEWFTRFAAIVRAEALEEAAAVCDGTGAGYTGEARRLSGQHATHAAGQRDGANECAAAIRALKDSPHA